MKRKVKNLTTGIMYESIADAEKRLGIYGITYNCQGKVDFTYVRHGKGEKVYEKWIYID